MGGQWEISWGRALGQSRSRVYGRARANRSMYTRTTYPHASSSAVSFFPFFPSGSTKGTRRCLRRLEVRGLASMAMSMSGEGPNEPVDRPSHFLGGCGMTVTL